MCAWDTREADVDRFVDDREDRLVHASRELPPGPVEQRMF
jgi:hypothetical protein